MGRTPVAVYVLMAAVFGGIAISDFVETDELSHGVVAYADVIKGGPVTGHAVIEFSAPDGHLVRTKIGGGEVGHTGDRSRIRFLAGHPTHVIGTGATAMATRLAGPCLLTVAVLLCLLTPCRRLFRLMRRRRATTVPS